MKRVLVTGGAGSIGYHVLKEFLQLTDWEIITLDSFRHRGYHERINYLLGKFPEFKSRLIVLQTDLTCPISDALKKQIGEINYIIHLAAVSDVFWGQDNPVYTVENNVRSSMMMFEYAKTVSHDAFIYFSTDEVYGPVKKSEAHKEWATHRPSNFYSASKAMGEDLGYAYWRNGDVKLIITNTMNNFGEWQSKEKFPVKIQRSLEKDEEIIIHGTLEEIGTRFYIHSKRVARTLIDILKNKPPYLHKVGELDEPDRYHIVSSTCLSNLELAEKIASLMDKKLKYKLQDFHKDNPAHDIHYGLENNKLKIEEDFESDMKEVIEFQSLNDK